MAYPCIRCGELTDSGEEVCEACEREIVWELDAEDRKGKYDAEDDWDPE